MLIEILKSPKTTIEDFVSVAKLLSLVDRPLKGSVKWEDVGLDDLANLEIEADERMEELRMKESGTNLRTFTFLPSFSEESSEKKELENAIKKLPFRKVMDAGEGHREAFREVLHKVIGRFKSEKNMKTPRFITLWLLMLAFDLDGEGISPNKHALIDEFRSAFEVEDDVFEELQERAKSLHEEFSKTMVIITE